MAEKFMPQFQKINNKDEWQQMLDKVLFKTFFHHLEWENFLEQNFKWLKFERYLYQDQALLSLARVQILGKEKLISHPFCEYGGPLFLKEKIDFQAFKKDLLEEFKEPLRISFHPKLLNYFENIKLEDMESWRDTYLIENFSQLKKEDLLSSFRYDTRHAIKKAEKQGFTFEEAKSGRELREFYKLYLQTVKRHKNIPVPFSFFKFFNKSAKIFLLKKENKIVTGSIFLFYNNFIHYFITGSNYNILRKFNANHLLLWRVMKKYIGCGYDFFDLGATRRDSHLEIFKRGWRGKKYPIFELNKLPLTEGLRRSKLRNILGVLPCSLLKRLSPYLLKYKL